MEKELELTCGFMLVNDGVFGRCGKPATYRFKKAPLCDECAGYVMGRGFIVLPISNRFIKENQKKNTREVVSA